MARKPNYEFERRERDRLKAIKVAEKAQAKRDARERAKAEAADAPSTSDSPGREDEKGKSLPGGLNYPPPSPCGGGFNGRSSSNRIRSAAPSRSSYCR